VLVEILFQENDVVAINKAIAIMETELRPQVVRSSQSSSSTAGEVPRTSSACGNLPLSASRNLPVSIHLSCVPSPKPKALDNGELDAMPAPDRTAA
jgi:pyruvate/2-oxoglutarate dehydrogenase complex dihydrolipoamide acyltransferase (E2) component